MANKFLLLLVSLIYFSNAVPDNDNDNKNFNMKRCNTNENEYLLKKELVLNDKKELTNYKTLLINVKFIVIHDDFKGKISNTRINNQIQVLNEAFGGKQHELGVNSKIMFKLLNTIYVNDKSLYNSCGYSESKIINKNITKSAS